MTPITSWQIVGGKLSSRMLTAVMLIGLTLPVLAIVRLLGGVEIADLFVRRGGELVRADGFPPHADRFERAGHDLSALLAQGVT